MDGTIQTIQRNSDRVLALLFIALMAALAVLNVPALRDAYRAARTDTAGTLQGTIRRLEKEYTDLFFLRSKFIDLNALAHLAMGQKVMNQVYRNADGMLFSFKALTAPKTADDASPDSLVALYRYAQEKGLPFLYVQHPSKVIRQKTVLSAGLADVANDTHDRRLGVLRAMGIPTLDLRESIRDHLEFYRTDHHWTVRTAFYATQSIVERLNSLYHLGLDPDGILTSLQNFDSLRYEDCFLGSHGIRVGPLFAGMDDFEMLVPRFETDLHYRHYSAHRLDVETDGAFPEAFVDFDLLEDPNYLNKYNACLKGGYVENVVENRLASNDLKVLLVANSFARAMVQYFSLCFRETRQLDPQGGRYSDSFIEYMEAYRPDVVVVMFYGSIPL